MAKTITNNTFDNKAAGCDDDKVARSLGGAHPKSQPPAASPFASGPSGGGGSLAPTPQPDGSEEE